MSSLLRLREMSMFAVGSRSHAKTPTPKYSLPSGTLRVGAYVDGACAARQGLGRARCMAAGGLRQMCHTADDSGALVLLHARRA